MNTKDKKKSNRTLIIVSCICAAVAIALVCVLAFIDPIVGNVKLNKVRDAARDCTEAVIADPLHDASFYRGAEVILTDDEARKLADSFLAVTEDTSYKKVIDGSKGFWDMRVDFCTDEEKHTVYLREDSIYVAGNNGYLFEIDGDSDEKYASFYETVVSLLSEE